LIPRRYSSSLTLSGSNAYNGITNVSGGTLILASNQALPGAATLIIGPLGKVVASNVATGTYALNLNTLSNTGLLDLAQNAAIIHTGSALASFNSQLYAGSNKWGRPLRGDARRSKLLKSGFSVKSARGLTRMQLRFHVPDSQ
jgi:autotransporter-associated beta strand protein